MAEDHYTEDDESRLMTPSEVASLFGVDTKTVTRWSKSGKLPPALRTLGGHRRYREAAVLAARAAASAGRGLIPAPRKPVDVEAGPVDDPSAMFDLGEKGVTKRSAK
jgi:excisionase family DNA binding protein